MQTSLKSSFDWLGSLFAVRNAKELLATMYLPLKSILPEGHDVGNG